MSDLTEPPMTDSANRCRCGEPAVIFGQCASSNGWWTTLHCDVPLCAAHVGVIDLATFAPTLEANDD